MFVTVGRTPNTEGLGLAEAGIATDSRGYIVADECLETNVPGVYAIGDVLGPARIMLAHMAVAEGHIAAANCLGAKRAVSYDVVPSGIFSSPEVGDVGLTEAQAKARGQNVAVGLFQFRELGKAQAHGRTARSVQAGGGQGHGQAAGGRTSPEPMPRTSSRRRRWPCTWGPRRGTWPKPSTPTPPWPKASLKPPT